MNLVVLVCFVLLILNIEAKNVVDQGYDLIFKSNYDTISRRCISTEHLPETLIGKTYLIQGVGGFEFGNESFEMVLDGFGKLYRFDFESDAVCIEADMLRSDWYNQSLDLGRVAPGLIFADTDPPRPKCGPMHPMCNVKASNDNDYVLPLRIGDQFFLTTDNPVYLKYDPDTMQVAKWTFDKGDLRKPLMNMISMGAAHTIPMIGGTKGAHVGVAMAEPDMMTGSATMYVYRIDDEAPDRRYELNSFKLPNDYTPYIHAFGLT